MIKLREFTLKKFQIFKKKVFNESKQKTFKFEVFLMNGHDFF